MTKRRGTKVDGLIIIKLSRDKKGLLVKLPQSSDQDYWHVHSYEMTRKQRKIHRRLLTQ